MNFCLQNSFGDTQNLESIKPKGSYCPSGVTIDEKSVKLKIALKRSHEKSNCYKRRLRAIKMPNKTKKWTTKNHLQA